MANFTVYGFSPSHNAIRTELALLEKGIAFDRVEVDLMSGEHRKPPLSEVNPRGQVPTLVYDAGDGPIVVYESIATIRFIDDVHPTPALMPPVSEPAHRARAIVRLEEFQAKLDPKNIFGSVAFRKQTREQLGTRVDDLLVELAQWNTYAEEGAPYLAGEQFTLADIAVFPLLSHFEALGYDYARHSPALAAYIDRCQQRPSVQKSEWLGRFQQFMDVLKPARVLAD